MGQNNQTASVNMSEVKSLVDSKISSKKVMVFSKSYCPYCTMAKQALNKYIGDVVPASDYEVMEIENMPECSQIQEYLQQLTGGRTVSFLCCEFREFSNITLRSTFEIYNIPTLLFFSDNHKIISVILKETLHRQKTQNQAVHMQGIHLTG